MKRTAIKSGKPPQRKTRLKAGTSKLAPVNVKQKAKRKIKQAKHYASAEYKAAREERVLLSRGQCEAVHIFDALTGVLLGVRLPGDPSKLLSSEVAMRCPIAHGLIFHETHYGSDVGIIREIQGVMLCEDDNAYIETTRHPTRGRRF